MKFKLLLVTLTLAIVYTGSAIAEKPYDKVPPVRVLKVALNLTDEQVTTLRELIETRAAEIKTIAEQVTQLQAQLEDLLDSDAPDPAEVGGLVLDIRGLKQEIRQQQEIFQQAFQLLLTPRQLERLGQINQIALANRAAEALRELRLR